MSLGILFKRLISSAVEYALLFVLNRGENETDLKANKSYQGIGVPWGFVLCHLIFSLSDLPWRVSSPCKAAVAIVCARLLTAYHPVWLPTRPLVLKVSLLVSWMSPQTCFSVHGTTIYHSQVSRYLFLLPPSFFQCILLFISQMSLKSLYFPCHLLSCLWTLLPGLFNSLFLGTSASK